MVGGTPKPFACTNEGCTMTFTNEDHLNVHQKKHEMVLNLGCKQNIIVADQTPTPTRFLRNCEEVGLFQDLQNVNPFEETFRRAVELAKTGSLPEPNLPEDDTLHTPHVFPHLPEDNVNIYTATAKREKLSLSNVDQLGDAETIHTSHTTITSENSNSSAVDNSQPALASDETLVTLSTTVESPDHIYALDSESCRTKDKRLVQFKYRRHKETSGSLKPANTPTKLKLKQALVKKFRLSEQKDNAVAPSFVLNPVGIPNFKLAPHDKITFVNNVVPVYQPVTSTTADLPAILPKLDAIHLPSNQNITLFSVPKPGATTTGNENRAKPKSKPDEGGVDAKRQEMLERNRAAAIRCRERKKQRIGNLEEKLQGVCRENAGLHKEVVDLRNEVLHLKTLLLAHKDCPVTKAMNMGHNIVIGPPQIVAIPVALRQTVSPPNEEPENNHSEGVGGLHDNNALHLEETKASSVIVLNNTYTELNHHQ